MPKKTRKLFTAQEKVAILGLDLLEYPSASRPPGSSGLTEPEFLAETRSTWRRKAWRCGPREDLVSKEAFVPAARPLPDRKRPG